MAQRKLLVRYTARITSTGFARLIRGLYRKERGSPLPPRVRIRAHIELEHDPEGVGLLANIFRGVPTRSVGTILRYGWREPTQYLHFSAWVLEFYGSERFAVFTIDPDHVPPGISLEDT